MTIPACFLIHVASFLNDIERVASSNYQPSDDDIVRARLRTVGLQEHKFVLGEGPWIMPHSFLYRNS